MVKINTDWVRKATGEKKGFGRDRQSSGGGGYRFAKLPATGVAKFRACPPDNEGRLGNYVGRHYNVATGEMKDGSPVTTSVMCIEASFPDQDHVCPVCENLRKLRDIGVDENTLGEYEPAMKSYLKVQMHEPKIDDKGPFKPDEPVILEMTEYSLTWILQQTLDPDVGDFLSPTRGAVIKFDRPKRDAKWERKILDSTAEGGGPMIQDAAELEAFLEKAANIDLYNIWKLPDDEYMTKIKTWAGHTYDHIKGVWDELHKIAEGVSGDNTQVEAPAYTPSEEVKTETKTEEAAGDPPFDTSPQTTEVKTEVKKEPEVAAVTNESVSATAAASKPSGAPDCFGDRSVYDAASNKCVMCDLEFECSQRVDAA